MLNKINIGFIRALVKRDLWRYFTNPTGYVFITVFIFLSATGAFWMDRFFQNNLANLDQLNAIFPYLLVLFIPALTMAVWSEERNQATDELLLTLPATSLEVVLGKYIAVLGIYTASLVLSLSHVLVLFWLGSPDPGLMIGNYVGYWLIGAAMLAVGMLASQLTSNTTISFVVGALLCAFLAFTPYIAGELLSPLGVWDYFSDFARGVVSLSGVLYFVSLASLAIYLNVLMIESRHWPRKADGYPMWAHHALRVVSLVLVAVAVNTIIGRASVRLDVTAERLHSLSSETLSLIGDIPEDRPVFIHAFISPEVPEQFVQTRENVLGLLKEIDSLAGTKVEVIIEETEPFTQAARDAREKFGIVPRQAPNLANARTSFSQVFLGLAFTAGAAEQVIPFMDRGLPAEYEITRSIRVVAGAERKKVGVVNTQINLFGGLDFQTMQTTPEWGVVRELKKQYEVVPITPDGPITEEVDGLLVPLPSSMSQAEMDNVLTYMETGKPTLLLVDPLPVVNVGLSPSETGGSQNPFQANQGPPPKEKGNVTQFLSSIGISWGSNLIVWDSYNPHPDLAQLAPEIVFVGAGNENERTFNLEHPSSRGLQELVLMYPGFLNGPSSPDFEFQPLVRTGLASGPLVYFQIVQRSFFGVQLNTNLPHQPDPNDYVLAAHVRGTRTDVANVDGDTGQAGAETGNASTKTINAIVIADLDFISEQFFMIREQGAQDFNFDNVTFFLNAIDVLVGDESFVTLRNKRRRHRTLERVEAQTRNFVEARVVGEQQAEADAQTALDDAQQRLTERVNEVEQRPDLDAQTKQIMARNLQEVENRRFEVLKTNIEAEKEAKVSASMENMEAEIRQIQSNIRTFAVLLPPLPVFAIGVWIFWRRKQREKEGASAARRLRQGS